MLAGHPLMGRPVLVHHHALERCALAAPAVLAACCFSRNSVTDFPVYF